MISSEELSLDVALAKVFFQVRYNPLQNWVFIHSAQKVKCKRDTCYSSLPNRRTGLNKRTGWKKIKKLINAQGLIIIILYCLIRAHRVNFFPKKISAHVRLLGRPEYEEWG